MSCARLTSNRHRIALLCAAASSVLSVSSPRFAAIGATFNATWGNFATGNYGTATNWSGGDVPDNNVVLNDFYNVVVNRAGGATVTGNTTAIILNLTIPKAHVPVAVAALDAGKHTYAEKPLGISREEGQRVMRIANERKLRVGCAPDTFLGGGHQTARKVIDDGAIGRPVAGTAFFMCPGHERWHPAPGFYYLRGGGPMLDMGPYYITDLIQLLGPIASVMGSVARPRLERLITSEPLKGTLIPVEVATHVGGILEFASGTVVSIAMSFDVPKHNNAPIEIVRRFCSWTSSRNSRYRASSPRKGRISTRQLSSALSPARRAAGGKWLCLSW